MNNNFIPFRVTDFCVQTKWLREDVNERVYFSDLQLSKGGKKNHSRIDVSWENSASIQQKRLDFSKLQANLSRFQTQTSHRLDEQTEVSVMSKVQSTEKPTARKSRLGSDVFTQNSMKQITNSSSISSYNPMSTRVKSKECGQRKSGTYQHRSMNSSNRLGDSHVRDQKLNELWRSDQKKNTSPAKFNPIQSITKSSERYGVEGTVLISLRVCSFYFKFWIYTTAKHIHFWTIEFEHLKWGFLKDKNVSQNSAFLWQKNWIFSANRAHHILGFKEASDNVK